MSRPPAQQCRADTAGKSHSALNWGQQSAGIAGWTNVGTVSQRSNQSLDPRPYSMLSKELGRPMHCFPNNSVPNEQRPSTRTVQRVPDSSAKTKMSSYRIGCMGGCTCDSQRIAAVFFFHIVFKCFQIQSSSMQRKAMTSTKPKCTGVVSALITTTSDPHLSRTRTSGTVDSPYKPSTAAAADRTSRSQKYFRGVCCRVARNRRHALLG